MAKVIDKTVNLELVGLNGNAYSLIGQFRRQARKEGWAKEEINAVVAEATKSDYDHLLSTLSEHCSSEDEDFGDDEDDYDEYDEDEEDEEDEEDDDHVIEFDDGED